MKYLCKKILLFILFIYAGFTLWFFYDYFVNTIKEKNVVTDVKDIKKHISISTVEIWGKAAIGNYFWNHIFEGSLANVPGYLLQKDEIHFDELILKYLTGPYLQTVTANKKVVNLIIILNGREGGVVTKSKVWLDALLDENIFPSLRNLAVLMLGDERCNNDWLIDYYRQQKKFKFIYSVYDIPMYENVNLFQWPLGVATYRNFPLVKKNDVDFMSKRKYKCNFIATVYKNSSREVLDNILKKSKSNFNCFVDVRYKWQKKETENSKNLYHQVLKDSDLTLCPVGINSESYRIYEALSYGSLPIIEDIMTPGQCGGELHGTNSPYRLLKKYHNAPVLYIKDWNHLHRIIENEQMLSEKIIVERRKAILEWYEIFRHQMKEEFLDTLKKNFN